MVRPLPSCREQPNPTGYAQVIEERKDGVLQAWYGYGPMRAFAVYPAYKYGYNTTPVRYYGYDGHGSVRYLTDETNSVVHTYDYDAFGNLINETDTPVAKDSQGNFITVLNNYMFAGEQYDPDLGLYYNRARYLDIRMGRFWGMDSWEGDAREPESLHKYLYTNSDPANSVDPTGNDSLAEGAISAGIVGTLTGISISIIAFSTFGLFAYQNFPKDAFTKKPSGKVFGFQAAKPISDFLNGAKTPFIQGLQVGLQFTAAMGGVDFVVPDAQHIGWLYGYFGLTAGIRATDKQNALSNLLDGNVPFNPLTLKNAAAYAGYVWNVNTPGDYAGPFFCISASPRLAAFIPGLPINLGGTVCSSPSPDGVRSGAYSYTVNLSSGGSSVLSTSGTYYFKLPGEIPIHF